MDETMADTNSTEPFPIFRVAGRYLIFDVNVVSYLRTEHHICGVLIGSIPLAAQQNVFSGLPLELLPEEARLLLEKRIVYVVDDAAAHEQMSHLTLEARQTCLKDVEVKKIASAKAAREQSLNMKKIHFEKARAKLAPKEIGKDKNKAATLDGGADGGSTGPDDLLFGPTETSTPVRSSTPAFPSPGSIAELADRPLVPNEHTPTTSYPPLVASPNGTSQDIPEATSSYYLYAHLHSKGYFMSPGLRFGCQFVAYPGDPLRYHSHFLSVSKEWDEPIDLIDIVGGGRLGTGVKKGYLLGGLEEAEDNNKGGEKPVRTFCFEWAAM
jgi:tRNA-splicing endonuclease subunit Sen34